MSNQQEVRIANSSPVHTASEKSQDIPTGSQPPRQVEEDPNRKRTAANSQTTFSENRNESIQQRILPQKRINLPDCAGQVEKDPNRKRTAANSPTTSSENRNESIQQRILPQRRINLPDCARCKKPPVEPHAVYCCGSMYCHNCLVSKMAAAASEGGIVTCDKCKKPMGENPTKQKTSRAEMAAADSSESSQPPAKISRIGSQPQFQGNTMVMSDGGYPLLTAAAPNRIPITASAPVAGNQPFLVAQRAFGSAPPYALPRPPLNIPISQSHSPNVGLGEFPTNFITAGAPNSLLTRPPNTRQVFQPTQTPSLPSQTPSMGPIPTQSVVNLPSIPPSNSFPPTVGANPLMQPTPNLIQNTHRVLRAPPPLAHPLPLQPRSGLQQSNGGGFPDSLPSIEDQKSARLTKSEAKTVHMASTIKSINEMDEILPIPPNPYAEQEKKLKLLEKLEENKAKPPPTKPILVGGTCTICWGGSKIPVQINCCSRIFCRECLVASMNLRPRCPSCNKVYAQKDISQSYVEMAIPEPVEPHSVLESAITKIDMSKVLEKFKGLDEFTLSAFINGLSSLREQKYKEERNLELRTLSVGLGDLIRKCKFEISSIQRQMDAALQDKKFIDGGYSRECSLCGGKISAVSQLSVGGSSLPTLPRSRDLEQQTIIDKNERLKSHFDAFCTSYYDIFNKYSIYSNEEPSNVTQNRINAMLDFSEGITKYGKLTKVASLNYDCEPNPAMSIISSLEFDTTGERFVVAGVTRKIKIFNFNNFFYNQKKRHVPLTQLHCQAAISNISWNPVQNEILASSDYDGHVSLWDVEAGKVVKSFHEREEICWTVNFNSVDPKLLASGSDDGTVKIWDINCDRSMANIEAKVNVCCVYFSPSEQNQLIFGSADHGVHLYDIRNIVKPLTVFRGHLKGVSYVRFLSSTTIVSASIDSSLRVWDTVEGRCLKVLKGHTNEKNFVGLSSNGDHILCGSENGRVFLYYKGLSEPLASYVLGKDGSTNDDDAEGFVSSVCWKKGTNYALAANSHGKVHLLEAK